MDVTRLSRLMAGRCFLSGESCTLAVMAYLTLRWLSVRPFQFQDAIPLREVGRCRVTYVVNLPGKWKCTAPAFKMYVLHLACLHCIRNLHYLIQTS